MENNIVSNQLIEKIESLLLLAREKVAVQVNSTLLLTYMEIGKTIVEEQNLHKDDPDYNNKSITELSKILTKKFGKGFSRANIWNMVHFYKKYRTVQSLTEQLTWTHWGLNNKIFTSQYVTCLPRKEELIAQVEMILNNKDNS